MTPEEAKILERIEQKLDSMSTSVTTLVVKGDTLEKTVEKHEQEIEKLKAAYYKAMGILAFLSLPGVGTAFWLSIQSFSKTP